MSDAHRKTPTLPVVIAFGLIACVLYGFGAGLRSDIGILLTPLAAQCGLAYQDVSLCIAVMQIVFGATQPFFGMLALRRSNRLVLLLGAAIMALSMVGMVLARSFASLMLSLGVLFGAGAGALAFGLVLTSAIRFVGPERAMLISGMLNAAAGLVGFALSPILQGLLKTGGVVVALGAMLVPVAALVPIAVIVTSRDPKPLSRETPVGSATSAHPIRLALGNRTFLLLVAGFTTCGLHMVIIESHLFNQYVLYGIDGASAAWAFSVYGIATIVGALLSGWLSTRVRQGRLLGFYYGFRAVWVAVFLLLMPKTMPFAVLFATGLGLTGDATVSPTAGLVNREFHIEHVATLIGVLFFCHQIGAFVSAWLGGVLLDATGGYTAIWSIDIVMCVLACAMSLRIRHTSAPAAR
ncbi:MFS transporter [Actinomyces viscosus]|uniref:MFS transporter n=1 Tax=Actinomyces viscosus TaxID=1656 RepID=UPI0028F048C4|nr:MFS transporter [Actinomyces viscosus]